MVNAVTETAINKHTDYLLERSERFEKLSQGGLIGFLGDDPDKIWLSEDTAMLLEDALTGSEKAHIAPYASDGITNQEFALYKIESYHDPETSPSDKGQPSEIDFEKARRLLENYGIEQDDRSIEAMAYHEWYFRTTSKRQNEAYKAIHNQLKNSNDFGELAVNSFNYLKNAGLLNDEASQNLEKNGAIFGSLIDALYKFMSILSGHDPYSRTDESFKNTMEQLFSDMEKHTQGLRDNFTKQAHPNSNAAQTPTNQKAYTSEEEKHLPLLQPK